MRKKRKEEDGKQAVWSLWHDPNLVGTGLFHSIYRTNAYMEDTREMDAKALNIVAKYISEHLDKSDPKPRFDVYVVWKAKILQNWKYLISSSLYDGMYYELTYNGDKNEWYLDAYKKFENRVIEGELPSA